MPHNVYVKVEKKKGEFTKKKNAVQMQGFFNATKGKRVRKYS